MTDYIIPEIELNEVVGMFSERGISLREERNDPTTRADSIKRGKTYFVLYDHNGYVCAPALSEFGDENLAHLLMAVRFLDDRVKVFILDSSPNSDIAGFTCHVDALRYMIRNVSIDD